MMSSIVLCFAAARRRSRMGERGSLCEQLLRGKSQAVNDRERLGPLFMQKAFSLPSEQKPSGSLAHIHAATAAFFDQALIPLEHRERVESIVGGHCANGRQRVTLLQRAL